MDLLERLRRILPDGLLTGAEMAGHLTGWLGGPAGQALCVALPRSTAEVSAIVSASATAGHGIIPQGGNTGLTGAGVPQGDFSRPPVVLSLSRMRRIRELDVANGTITVEAGAVLADVQQAARAADRLFPVSLGAEGSCQIGGIISTNAGGTNVLRYGSTRAQVLGLEVVLPDGTVWDGLTGLRKNNTGYELRQLFIGAEGTLGVITAAVLRLHPLPKMHATAWVGLPDPAAGLALLSRLQAAAGEVLTAYELMNEAQLQTVLAHRPDLRAPLAARWHLLVELADLADAPRLEDALQTALAEGLDAEEALDVVPAASGAQRAMFWAIRHGTAESNRRSGPMLSADVAVPVSALPEFLDRAMAAVRGLLPGAEFLLVSHMGDGNVHFGMRLPPDATPALMGELRRIVNDCAMALSGTFSAEHGIGRKLTEELEARADPVTLALMRRIRAALDPQGIMNPACLLRPE